MADLRADTDELRRRAATINAVGEDHSAIGAFDATGVDSQIDAFGEINQVMHGDWRDAKAKQSDAWSRSGQAHGDHAEQLSANAFGYDGQDLTNAQNLRNTD